MTETQRLPHNSEAEASVLGSIMRDNQLLDALHFLKEEYFFFPLHQRIFAACREKFDDGELATPITLKAKFSEDAGLPDGQTGIKYLLGCVTLSGQPQEAIRIARYMKDLAERRDLIAACEKAAEALRTETENNHQAAETLSSVCEKIMAGDKKWEMQTGTEVIQDIIQQLKDDVRPFSTGIRLLDKAMDGGLFPGKLYGFAGKKKHGKTVLGATISVNLACAGVKHLFICGEMSSSEIQQRNLARMGKFFGSDFHTGNAYRNSPAFQQKLAEATQWQHQNIIFQNIPDLTFPKLKHIVKQAVLRHNIKGYILDYWQLVGGKDSKKSMAEHLDEVAQWMAASAKKYGVFAITLAQINQEGNTRGGEGLRLACDQLYQIQRPDLGKPPMWLEMMDTRYTAWNNIGEEGNEKLSLNGYGPWFEEFS